MHNNGHKTKRLMRRRNVQEVTGLSRSGMYALIAKGEFPKPISLVPGGRSVAWDADAVQTWITARIDAARAS